MGVQRVGICGTKSINLAISGRRVDQILRFLSDFRRKAFLSIIEEGLFYERPVAIAGVVTLGTRPPSGFRREQP